MDYKSILYQCPNCNNMYTAKAWNDRTQRAFDGGITLLQETISTEDCYFSCPFCKNEPQDSTIKRIYKIL